MGFEQYNPHLAPVPVNGTFGRTYHAAAGELQDDELDLLKAAMLSRLPSRCPDDALDANGAIDRIPRYGADSHDSYRERLKAAWPTWEDAGSPVAIETQFQAFGVPDVAVVQDYEATLGLGSWYSRFVVVIGPDFGVMTITPTLQGEVTQGAPTLQGGTGGSELLAQIRALKRIVLKWKSAHSYPCDIVFLFSADSFVGAGAIPGSYVNSNGDYLVHAPIGHLLPVEAPTEALPYQV